MTGRIVQISVAPRGGVPKAAVPAADVTPGGLAGNAVAHPGIHGGPARALCLYSEEHILALQKEGHPIRPGSTGENVTIAGIDWSGVAPGMILQLGHVVRIEVSSAAAPCQQISASFADGDSMRISQKKHPGWSRWYARVLIPGKIEAGDPVRIVR
jgi:MOSC domain-containing protein YiiM